MFNSNPGPRTQFMQKGQTAPPTADCASRAISRGARALESINSPLKAASACDYYMCDLMCVWFGVYYTRTKHADSILNRTRSGNAQTAMRVQLDMSSLVPRYTLLR